jgi:hypothetical protein
MIRHLRLIPDNEEVCAKCNGTGILIGTFEGVEHRVMCYGDGACWGSGIAGKPFDNVMDMHVVIKTMQIGAQKMKDSFNKFQEAWSDVETLKARLRELKSGDN